ncbi:xanthine dehydrogenase family protein molybdopterin-binding subunit [Marinobacterium rhizophilum]|uniref:Xanthine dehydrogenase family protein molybdopterin-binding subunit n=1 Tax=Marinobacterium rhizophilum TaxID=420402 RepID=A0ABY5HHG7_9GAMM|nr:xanthine dehydrogenase family protein molybdopterin-binding subunit [Marinobacterium rhizophilum]UTW11291.1 xanthine dehydrogenase family protein molybdopterin-binding subunit [Marinobacterium rhizophilum]
MNKSGIGARVRRVEDKRMLQGKGRFVSDIRVPGLQDVAFLRSPLAHGRIKSITRPQGSEQTVFTVDDMQGVKPIRADSNLPSYRDSEHWVLARGKVRFVGEPVVMCVAHNRAAAEDLVEQVELELESLAPITGIDAALDNQGPRVHEHWDNNLFLDLEVGEAFPELASRADVIIEREYKLARQVMNPMEGKGVVAYWDEKDDQLVVYTSTQVAHLIRTGLSECLGLPQGKIRVIAPDVGGGFGYKCILQPEEVAVAWLAMKYRKAYRWIEDRREHLVAGANTREHHYKIKAYADKRGRLLGLDAVVAVDIGAYSVWPFTAGLEAAQAGGNLPGPYKFDHYRCKVLAPATNKPPFCPYRGVARPGVCFAIERTIDEIAKAVGREAWEVRAENLVPADVMPFTNVTGKLYDSGDYPESLRRAVAMIDIAKVRQRQQEASSSSKRIGLGFATFTEQSAHGTKVFAAWGLPLVPGYETATAKLTADGGLEIRAGINTIGQGLQTTLSQVASEVTTIPLDRIKVVLGDTGTTPYSTGAYASRGMVMAGGAVSRACAALMDKLRRLSAGMMQCQAEEVVLEQAQAKGPGMQLGFDELGDAWYLHPDRLPEGSLIEGLEATGYYKPKVDTGAFSYATHAVVVSVDTETGHVEIQDYAVVEDCGQMVNPMIVEGQTIGGIAQGIGTALYEEVLYDTQGQPLTSTLADYILPGATDVPNIRIEHLEHLSPFTEHGIKGVGEGGAIAPAGAIVNAINDALCSLGVQINETPASPERILKALHAGRDQQPVTEQENGYEARAV